MGLHCLRPLLRGLCCNSPWDYAVFWKLKPQGEMILVWEDGFCDTKKSAELMGGSIGNFSLEYSNEILSSSLVSNVRDDNPCDYPIGFAVAEMSKAFHVVGQGILGEAAYTGNPCWIHSDDIARYSLNSDLVMECLDEWLPQFVAGVKTILLLPMLPDGVLQLGSLQMVVESEALVDDIKAVLKAHIEFESHNMESPTQHFPPFSVPTGNLVRPYAVSEDNMNYNQTLREGVDNNLGNTTNRKFDTQLSTMSHSVEPQFHHQSLEDENIDTAEKDLLKSIFGEDTYYPDNFAMDMYGVYDSSYFEGHMTVPTFVDTNTCEEESNSVSFLWDFELQQELGPAVSANNSQLYDWSMLGYGAEYGTRHLQDSFDAKACNISEENSSNISNIVNSLHRPSGKDLAHSIISECRNSSFDKSASSSPVISVVTCEHQERKASNSLKQGKKIRKPVSKKRNSRFGDNERPRPRDRQLIQERLKELRELVPGSEKCSIDGLLDKTIKQMLFLSKVTNQAEDLKRQVLREDIDEKKSKASHQNGVSWAVELGNEQRLYPIVVKDLEHPQHMLIKMLCNDHGRFLEIADVIHRLQLTILKGELETNVDNSWACFIVKVSTGFHRLDIFWPLMQLLQ